MSEHEKLVAKCEAQEAEILRLQSVIDGMNRFLILEDSSDEDVLDAGISIGFQMCKQRLNKLIGE